MNFNKHYNEYEKYSLAQKQVAKNLLDYMGKSNIFNTQINSIFEIGCGTGIFTKEYRKYFLHSDLILNDIFDVREFIKDIDYNIFIQENIEEFKEILKKYFSSVKSYSETIKLDFEVPMAVLKHLKHTGVTGFQRTSISKIKTFKDNILTYKVAYFICKK